LPELFISDLHAVLSLLVISKLNASSADPPTDENIRQHGIILGVKYLLDSRDMIESQKALLQLILADALLSYGTQESLEQALSEYQAVLKEYPRNRSWLDWAMVQTNFGDALRFLGERGGSHEHLNQAVATYQEDQKKLTGHVLPLGWMLTQLKVGATLEALASLQSDPARKEHLAQAIAIYQDILKVLPHDQLLLKLYAYLQTRRASAFGELGEPGKGVQSLTKIVAIYRETLQVVTRERDPMDWARTQYALGGTLQYWGKLEGGTEYFGAPSSGYGSRQTPP
jgi:tetratricopeptide (TPR) repeat protein